MAEMRFKAFLSCSFAKEDHAIVNFFEKYIESFGFDVLKYDYQEPVTLPDAVKNHIQKADCLIAIATRRDRIQESEIQEGTPECWICPEWIQHEIVYAHALGKQVAIFAENGVRVGGLIERGERFQRFSREESELLNGVPFFNKYLLAMRETLEKQMKAGIEEAPSLFYHTIHSRDELLLDGSFVSTCETEVESLVKGLRFCTEGIGDIDWIRAPQEAIEKFQFSVINAPQITHVEHQFLQDKERPKDWRVIFDPPLNIGERVKYAFRYSAKGVRPLTLEKAQEAIKNGAYWAQTPHSAVNWDLSERVGELTCEVFFPPNYPIHEPEVSVELYEGGLISLPELERIRELKAFEVEKFFDRYRLCLKVPKPIRGRYILKWYPPRQDELPAEYKTVFTR